MEQEFLTFNQTLERFKFMTFSRLRRFVRNKDFNERCVRKVGKTLFFKPDEIIKFMEQR